MTISKEDNPRQKLLELIAEKSPISIKDLKQITDMSIGSLYHHLSKLDQYVTQDEQKRYLLSQQGDELFKRQTILQIQKQPWFTSFIMPALRNKYSSTITIIAVLQLYLLIYTNSSQLILLPVKYGSVLESVILGWVLSVLVTEGLSITTGARPGYGILKLATGISLSTIPVVVLSLVDITYASIPLYIISLFIASATISSAKNMNFASSIPIAVSVLLISIAVFTIGFGVIVIIPIVILIVLIVLTRLGYFDIIAKSIKN